jgi:DNA-binding ferritin-like protein
MPDIPETIEEIEARIATVRENLRQLVEQASADSGARNEDLISQRIAEQEAQLELLTKKRDNLPKPARISRNVK